MFTTVIAGYPGTDTIRAVLDCLRGILTAIGPTNAKFSSIGPLAPGVLDNPPYGFVVELSPDYHIVVGCGQEHVAIMVEAVTKDRLEEGWGYHTELADPKSIDRIENAFKQYIAQFAQYIDWINQ